MITNLYKQVFVWSSSMDDQMKVVFRSSVRLHQIVVTSQRGNPMITNNAARGLAAALLLFAGLALFPGPGRLGQAQAQLPPPDAVRVPCCRCVGGSQQRININTRLAHWKVSMPGSSTFQPVVPAGNPAWTPLPPAGWVGPPGNPTAVGDYTYRLVIYVPRCVVPFQAQVTGRFAADNGAQVSLNGHPIAASQGTPNYGFLPGSVTPFSFFLGSGTYTLTFVVHNSGGPTGLIVNAGIVVTCLGDLERHGDD
jgi:hypothetical protein